MAAGNLICEFKGRAATAGATIAALISGSTIVSGTQVLEAINIVPLASGMEVMVFRTVREV
jgi:hypothetical protein